MASNSKFLLLSLVYFFSSLLSCSSFNNAIHKCSKEERDALLLFKQNLSSINYPCYMCREFYPILMNWNTSTDCCNWDGVTCNHVTGDVIGLDLSCGMLQGNIHHNTTLFHLPHLRRLNLARNDFFPSQLPHGIARFSKSLTHLSIFDCGFTGQVPSEISFLSKLVYLDLSENRALTLESHVLNNVFCNYTDLEELWLEYVYISSVLPIHLNISSSLKLLDLRSTSVSGNIPDNIFNLPYMEELFLSDNRFTGQNPLEISYLPNIVYLDLSRNSFPLQIQPYGLNNLLQNSTRLIGLSLSGINIGLVLSTHHNITSSLRYLDLSSTGLQGELPDNIFNLPCLVELQLFDNSGITGSIPCVNRSISSPLRWLDLSSMINLSPGEMPDSIGHLKSLEVLALSSCNLIGSLPNSLVNLRNLTVLELSNNKLNGTLSSWLFTLPSLEDIQFDHNQLDGLIDVHVQGLTLQAFEQLINLHTLDLSFNNFQGVWELDTLLSSLPNLTFLSLSYSGFCVTTNNTRSYVANVDLGYLYLASCKLAMFPESLRAMKNIRYLDLSNNEIQGQIPDWFKEIGGNGLRYLNLSHNSITNWPHFKLHQLKFLHLGNNHVHGTIPSVFQDCECLEGLVLNGNQFEGKVPSSLSKCRSLKVLDLGNNKFNGTFPRWLQNLPNLQVLDLKSNNFHGPIVAVSKVQLPFPSLKVLDLSNNGFVGHLPQIYFQNFNGMTKDTIRKGPKPQYLNSSGLYYSIIVVMKGMEQIFQQILVDFTIVDLSNNSFEGQIPNVIGNLNLLKMLNLSHNKLTGRIPYALGNLTEIESLDLSFNQLTGEIPQSLADCLTFLAVLNLSQNDLVGRIPEGKQFNTFNGNSFGANQELCGFPLSKKCEQQPHEQYPEADEVDEDSGFTWRPVALGYCCGTLFGLVMGYLMLSTGKPKWFNAIVDSVEYMIHAGQKNRR